MARQGPPRANVVLNVVRLEHSRASLTAQPWHLRRLSDDCGHRVAIVESVQANALRHTSIAEELVDPSPANLVRENFEGSTPRLTRSQHFGTV